MQRTKQTKETPTAILTADWHLREDQPVCRLDNFEEAQWKKVDKIAALQKKYNCPVWHAGDLFNHWKPSPYLLSETLKHLPADFWTVYGNHDLPQHNLSLAKKCGINTLAAAGRIQVLDTCHWGQTPMEASLIFPETDKKVLIWHTMTYQGEKPWPGMKAPKGGKLLRKYPEYDLILTGHNHTPFISEYDGRFLVNPGSITRQSADQIEYKPRVYLYYAKTNRVEPFYLSYNKNVVSREHIAQTQERDLRIDAFISKLDGDWKAEMSFEENLELFYQKNKTDAPVKLIIKKAISQ